MKGTEVLTLKYKFSSSLSTHWMKGTEVLTLKV